MTQISILRTIKNGGWLTRWGATDYALFGRQGSQLAIVKLEQFDAIRTKILAQHHEPGPRWVWKETKAK